MKSFLKFLMVVPLLVVFAFDASAQSRRRRSTYDTGTSSSYDTSTSSSSVLSSGGGNAGRMAVSGGIGFYGHGGAVYVQGNNSSGPELSGMFGLGGDFDYYMTDDMSVGGIFRYYSTSDSYNSVEYTNTLMTIGGVVRAHVFNTENWTGYITTGLGMVNATDKQGNTTVDPGTSFGFYWGLAALYKMSSNLHLGVENLRMMGLGSGINGWPLDDYFVKARFFF